MLCQLSYDQLAEHGVAPCLWQLRAKATASKQPCSQQPVCVPLARILDRPAIAQLAEHLTVDTLQ